MCQLSNRNNGFQNIILAQNFILNDLLIYKHTCSYAYVFMHIWECFFMNKKWFSNPHMQGNDTELISFQIVQLGASFQRGKKFRNPIVQYKERNFLKRTWKLISYAALHAYTCVQICYVCVLELLEILMFYIILYMNLIFEKNRCTLECDIKQYTAQTVLQLTRIVYEKIIIVSITISLDGNYIFRIDLSNVF